MVERKDGGMVRQEGNEERKEGVEKGTRIEGTNALLTLYMYKIFLYVCFLSLNVLLFFLFFSGDSNG